MLQPMNITTYAAMENKAQWTGDYYKWKQMIIADDKSKLKYDQPDIIEIFSPETFRDFDECVEAGRNHGIDLPDCYGGPYLQVISYSSKHKLDELYMHHKEKNIKEMYDALSQVTVQDVDEMPVKPGNTCKLLENLEDLKLKLLESDDCYDSSKTPPDFREWRLEPRFYTNWMEKGELCWHTDINWDLELAVDSSLSKRHGKLIIYKKGKQISLRPSEFHAMVQMYDSIMIKMYQSRIYQTEDGMQQDLWTDIRCKAGQGCMHDWENDDE